eukprot:m.118599 g.118599  ORF g.118599 m.118599 type:complete len:54 (+) comp16435_c1_seq1:189-350(+)
MCAIVSMTLFMCSAACLKCPVVGSKSHNLSSVALRVHFQPGSNFVGQLNLSHT